MRFVIPGRSYQDLPGHSLCVKCSWSVRSRCPLCRRWFSDGQKVEVVVDYNDAQRSIRRNGGSTPQSLSTVSGILNLCPLVLIEMRRVKAQHHHSPRPPIAVGRAIVLQPPLLKRNTYAYFPITLRSNVMLNLCTDPKLSAAGIHRPKF